MIKIGNYRKILKNTIVWSISLQENIKFDKDIIVKITNTIYDNDNYFFGKIQLVLFEHLIPTYLDKTNGDIGVIFDKTKPFNEKKIHSNFLLKKDI